MAKRYDIETVTLAAPHGTPEVLHMPVSGPLVVPGGGLLSDAVYARLDADLLIELADGTRLVVEGYFEALRPPPLVTDAGAHIGPDVVRALAGSDPGAIPAAVPGTPPIGRIETVSGDANIVRPDGSRIDAEPGMLIARGDRIETAEDGTAGFLFADDSTFSVGGHARATFEDLVYDPDTAAAHAMFVVQEGTFSFAGGGISNVDGAFLIKTPASTIIIDAASGAGRVESDGGTTVTFLRDEGAGDGVIKVVNPGGTELLDQSYETLTVDDFFQAPSSAFRIGPRDAAEHFGAAISALPDAGAVMPHSLLSTARGLDPASQAAAETIPADHAPMGSELASELHVDRDTAFEIAARKAAIARAARDAAGEALHDAAAAEQAAREQAEAAGRVAAGKHQTAEQLHAQALQVLQESERRDSAFEAAIRTSESASRNEDDAARAVAETDLAEARAAERLAAAEEAVRRALEAADRAREEALTILEEAKQKEQAFAAAQQAAQSAKADEEVRALAVAEADAAEEAAATALRAAEAAAVAAQRDAEVAERVAHEASTAAEIVETVVERELAAIDPELLKPPAADDPSSSKGDWITQTRAAMDVASAAMDAGEKAAQEAYRDALREGSTIEEALERAIIAAEAYGGAASADRIIAAGPDGLIKPGEDGAGDIAIAGGSDGVFGDGGTTGVTDSDVLIGGGGEDGLVGGFGLNGLDGVFGFAFSFTPIVLRQVKSHHDDDRPDPVTLTVTATPADILAGSTLADFLVGSDASSTVAGREGDDFLYGDLPTNLLSGTHNAGNALLNPSFDITGGDDLMSGGAGDDLMWGGAGNDTLYGDLPSNASGFGIDLGSAGNGADQLHGGDGNDILAGGGGADVLEGDGGDDTFLMGDDDGAADAVYGGDQLADSGNDTVDYAGAGALVSINLAAGTASGALTGNDILNGIESAIGTSFDDTISGSSAANSLSGGAGADTLSGLAGDDNIFGYADDDVLIGGTGDDTLHGGSGADEFRFEGGSGATTAAKVASLGTDIIADYNASESDLFMLSDDDFALGNTGTLNDGTNYFEADTTSVGAAPQNLSGGVANAGIVVIGAASGGGGAQVWYTEDASAMTNGNSYQIATVEGADRATIDAGDFHLKT